MNYNNREEVKNLRIKFCNEIENLFLNDETVEFDQPFNVYVTEEDMTGSWIKVPYLVKTMTSGQYLAGMNPEGDEFDDLSTYDLEDIVEVAYILDTIGDKSYKIIQDANTSST
jgi:hypothetical protein